ncbi:MAG: PepSY domain-containing protein [Spongiibacteraceae bacterium]
MKRWLYLIHRWGGIAVALFMFIWFSSGLVIMYAGSSALDYTEQLEGREALNIESGWITLEQAWQKSAAQRAELPVEKLRNEAAGKNFDGDFIASARLVRQAGVPIWQIENGAGQRFAVSAITGELHLTSSDEAKLIAQSWLKNRGEIALENSSIRHIDTGIQDSSVRNYETLRPFHRLTVGDGGRELLISQRTGEVVRDSTRFTRALYWSGNWIHLLRPIESLGSADARRNVQIWSGFIAAVASLTGIIIGVQRWRPGWFGTATYSKGRVHPYRDVWNTWHFWVGLIGGFAALLWAFSGYMNTNPFQLFSPANPSRSELSNYQGRQPPAAMLNWQPAPLPESKPDVVELQWRYLGDNTVATALTRDGDRFVQQLAGAVAGFSQDELVAAATRILKNAQVTSVELRDDYDSYYYRRHEQSDLDRPLPILRVQFADAAGTRFYLDPQNGRLVLKQDASRRVYRWLYSALHHWDFGWLQLRPLWDAWMLPLVGMGIALGSTSVVLGWKRLQADFKPKKKKKSAERKSLRPSSLNNPADAPS